MKKLIIAVFGLFAIIASCKRDDEAYTIGAKNGPDPRRLFTISSLSAIQAEADTASLIAIKLQIAPDADTLAHTIHIATNLGTFSDGKSATTVTANASGTALAYLRSGKTGLAQLTFTDQNLSIDTTVIFIAALPDDMTFTASNYTGDTSTSFSLTATLFRAPGKGIVADPVKVYYVVTSGPAGAGLILPDFSNSAAAVAGCTVANPYKVTGSFVIEAKTAKAGGDTIRKKLTLIIN